MRIYLCEKLSQGKDIARILGATQCGDICHTGASLTVTSKPPDGRIRFPGGRHDP
jgi:hypothetical protein